MQFPFSIRAESGYQREVAPGVHWLRLPLPFKPEDHINVWLLEDPQSVAVVDTGLADDETRELWRDALTHMACPSAVHRVYLTHHHPDHLGLAAWFEKELDALVHLPVKEMKMAQGMMQQKGNDGLVEIYHAYGMPIERSDVASLLNGFYRDYVDLLPQSPRFLKAIFKK